MYKRDRALKQQRKALMQAGGFRKESSPNLASSAQQRDFAFPGHIQPDPILLSSPLPTVQNDSMSHQPLSLRSLLPSDSPGTTQHQCTFFSNWTIKSEHNNHASSPGSAAALYINSDELCSNSPQSSWIPPLVMEFLRCDPDELQLQNKTTARLLQEQTGWNQHGGPSTFSLMCLLADQMLLFMVEWARTSIFFNQLKVRSCLLILVTQCTSSCFTSTMFIICLYVSQLCVHIFLFSHHIHHKYQFSHYIRCNIHWFTGNGALFLHLVFCKMHL